MRHPFEALKDEYTALLTRMQITRATDDVARKLLRYVDGGRYAVGCTATGVPQVDAAASFEREAASNFRLSPAQGDPWDRRSVHVPRGRGPFASFTAAQIDAYRVDRLDKVGVQNWTWERSCYEWELFNGFGYRARGIHTPYLWAGTNNYTRGKFVGDGEFSGVTVDRQLGVIPVMYRMIELRPDLALPVPFPGAQGPRGTTGATVPPTAPAAAPLGLRDAAALQAALNKLGANPALVVDDSYGRETRRAVEAFQQSAGLATDGIAGPETWLAINARLKAQLSAAPPALGAPAGAPNLLAQAWMKISDILKS